MEFVKHEHPLILYDYYHGGEHDVCYLCNQRLYSALAYSVYRCTRGRRNSLDECSSLLLHKSCAELPLEMTDYFMHPQHPLTLVRKIRHYYFGEPCSICSGQSSHTIVYSCELCDLTMCLRCVTSPLVYHPSHNQHALALVQRQATFRCDACGKEDRDLSCRCMSCPYWIHTSCALLSSSFQSKFHRHPLLLACSFPQQYLNFRHKCKVCKKLIKPTLWLYYCAGCRFFVHLQCAKAETTIRALGDDESGSLVHLPCRNESSVNLLRQLLIHQMMINQGEVDALTWSFSPISTITTAQEAAAAAKAGPDKEVIHHWSHDQHPLNLRNKCSASKKLQSVTLKDINTEDCDDDNVNIVSDGCTNPNQLKYCAELPKQIRPYKFPYEFETETYDSYQIVYTGISSSYLFRCDGCNQLKSGIYIATDDGNYKLDIGCATLPSKIKHEAVEHPLLQLVASTRSYKFCDACGLRIRNKEVFFHLRSAADQVYSTIHAHYAFRPYKLNHPWDSHALTLITPEDIIEDHPHDYNCEHCSDDIDMNYWFYHCSLCDLSCHMKCINKFYRYSDINFSAAGTQIEQQKLHEHGLTLVLNKRKRWCGSCRRQLFYAPVLHCGTCNFIICPSCVLGVDADLFE